MRKKTIALKSFLAKYAGMDKKERELVNELLKGKKYYYGDEMEDVKKYDTLVAWNVVKVMEFKHLGYNVVSLKEYE